jgi:hypothetical protein
VKRIGLRQGSDSGLAELPCEDAGNFPSSADRRGMGCLLAKRPPNFGGMFRLSRPACCRVLPVVVRSLFSPVARGGFLCRGCSAILYSDSMYERMDLYRYQVTLFSGPWSVSGFASVPGYSPLSYASWGHCQSLNPLLGLKSKRPLRLVRAEGPLEKETITYD